MSFMNIRGSGKVGKGTFAEKAKNRAKNTAKRRMPDGMFERWYPTEHATWIRIPDQAYTYKTYDRDEQEVIEVTTPWLEYLSHFVPSISKSFICSSGPYRTEACYGDALRSQFFEHKKQVEEETGMKEESYPPVSASRRHGLAVTVLETIYSVPLTDNKGKVRKNRNDEIIYKNVPKPVMEEDVEFKSHFGHNMHWSMGIGHLNEIADWDLTLRNKCANCGDDLFAVGKACEECEEPMVDLEEGVEGEDLSVFRGQKYQCSHCGDGNTGILLLQCPGCGDPREGGIMDFDIRVKAVPIGENQKSIRIVGVRVPDYDEDTLKLISNPLDIEGIFAPTPVKIQEKILGDMVKGVQPKEGAFTSSYDDDDDSDEEDDEDSGKKSKKKNKNIPF